MNTDLGKKNNETEVKSFACQYDEKDTIVKKNTKRTSTGKKEVVDITVENHEDAADEKKKEKRGRKSKKDFEKVKIMER